MVYYDHDIVSGQMMCHSWLTLLRQKSGNDSSNDNADIYKKAVDFFEPLFQKDDIVDQVLRLAEKVYHIMDFSISRTVSTLISYLNVSIDAAGMHQNYFDMNYQIPSGILEGYLIKKLVIGLIISTAGDCTYSEKSKIIDMIKSFQIVKFPPDDVMQYEVSISTGEWIPFLDRIDKLNTGAINLRHQDTIIRTTDTLYYESLIFSFLEDKKSILLCGPPGCGKSMMILSCLRALPDVGVSVINFSSTTTPQILLKNLINLCNYKKTAYGTTLSPKFYKRLVGKLFLLNSSIL